MTEGYQIDRAKLIKSVKGRVNSGYYSDEDKVLAELFDALDWVIEGIEQRELQEEMPIGYRMALDAMGNAR